MSDSVPDFPEMEDDEPVEGGFEAPSLEGGGDCFSRNDEVMDRDRLGADCGRWNLES